MDNITSIISGKRSKKLLVTFLLSYLLILAIPILIGSIAYIITVKAIGEEVNNSKMAMLRQVCHSLDSRLNEMQRTALEISMNFSVQDFLNIRSPLSVDDKYKATLAIRDLKPYNNVNYFVHDLYIYSKRSDTIVNSKSMYSPDFFYKNYYPYKDLSYEKWHDEILKKTYYNNYMVSSDMSSGLWPRRMITYLQSIPITDRDNPPGVVVMLIDEEKLKDMLGDIASGGMAYIVDSENNIVVSTDRFENIKLPDVGMLGSNEGLLEQRVNGRDLIVTYTTSGINQWKYVSIIPRDLFMEKADKVRDLIFWIVAFCLLTGIITAYFMANRNYSPINHTVNMLSSWNGGKPANVSNELEFIRDTVKHALNTNQQLEKTYEEVLKQNREFSERNSKYWPMVRSTLLNKLIKGSTGNFEDIEGYLKLQDITFPYTSFSVMLFHIDDCGGYANPENVKEWELARFVITSVTEDLANENGKGYILELEHDTMALIMNFPDQNPAGKAKKLMPDLAYKIRELLEKEFKTTLTIGIGKVHGSLNGVQESFREASMALDYKIIKGSSSIIQYDEIIDRDKDYYYPIDFELQLINSVKVGDIGKCTTLLENIFDENFNKRRLPLKLVKCLFFDIMSTAVKTLDEINLNSSDIYSGEFDPLEKLISCETVLEMHQEIKAMYAKICESINERRFSHNYALKEAVLSFIAEHYADDGLSQARIAEHLNITPNYLSKFFKQETGQNMVDYINKLRIEKAKQFLAGSQMSLHEISQQVGCTNDKTLIRIFKQYEGITPGKFRNGASAGTYSSNT